MGRTGKSIYEVATEELIQALERGVVPWRRPWQAAPANLLTRKDYRGFNSLALALAPYGSPYWMTMRQANELGGAVRKGEHGRKIVFWKILPPNSPEGEEVEGGKVRFTFRLYTVFNLEQVDGIAAPAESAPRPPSNKISRCQEVLDGMRNKPTINHGGGRAYYSPSEDRIQMPVPGAFDGAAHYWATLFHELGHATGHKSRLGRKGYVTPDDSAHAYGREELIAEMTAAFLCRHCGIDSDTQEQSTTYLGHWLNAIRADPRMLVFAGNMAQRAADHILGVSHEEPQAATA